MDILSKLKNGFPNEKTKEVLTTAYMISQVQNKALSDLFFYNLLVIKEIDPSFNIVIDENSQKSYFDANKNIVCLKDTTFLTFFHELTHAFSFKKNHFITPVEFYSLQERLLNSKHLKAFILFLNDIQYLKNELINSYNQAIHTNIDTNEIRKLKIYNAIEDILDAISDGAIVKDGLMSIDAKNQVNSFKLKGTFGHGSDYYQKTNYQFEEILANYLAIKLLEPNDKYFLILQSLIGEEFIKFLDRKICDVCNIYKNELEDNLKISK